jgi:hypothetical protein
LALLASLGLRGLLPGLLGGRRRRRGRLPRLGAATRVAGRGPSGRRRGAPDHTIS